MRARLRSAKEDYFCFVLFDLFSTPFQKYTMEVNKYFDPLALLLPSLV